MSSCILPYGSERSHCPHTPQRPKPPVRHAAAAVGGEPATNASRIRIALAAAALIIAGCQPLASGPLVICFGDSITEQGGNWGGYVGIAASLLREQCPHLRARVVAAGVGGSRVPDLERRYATEIESRSPDAVVVMIGINDVWHTLRGGGTPKAEFEAVLRRLVAKMQAADMRVVLCTPGVIGEKPDGTNPLDGMLNDYADVTRGIAAETGAGLVDLRREFKEHLQAHNPRAAADGILTYDGVHLTAAGNRVTARAVAEGIARVMPCKSRPPGPNP